MKREPLDPVALEEIMARHGFDVVKLRADRRKEKARRERAKVQRERKKRVERAPLIAAVEAAITTHKSDAFGEVYFLICERYVKIGYAAHSAVERLKSIRTCNPMPLRIAGVIPGPIALETALHEIFDDFRHSGEWFHLHPRVEETFVLLMKSKRNCIRKPRRTS